METRAFLTSQRAGIIVDFKKLSASKPTFYGRLGSRKWRENLHIYLSEVMGDRAVRPRTISNWIEKYSWILEQEPLKNGATTRSTFTKTKPLSNQDESGSQKSSTSSSSSRESSNAVESGTLRPEQCSAECSMDTRTFGTEEASEHKGEPLLASTSRVKLSLAKGMADGLNDKVTLPINMKGPRDVIKSSDHGLTSLTWSDAQIDKAMSKAVLLAAQQKTSNSASRKQLEPKVNQVTFLDAFGFKQLGANEPSASTSTDPAMESSCVTTSNSNMAGPAVKPTGVRGFVFTLPGSTAFGVPASRVHAFGSTTCVTGSSTVPLNAPPVAALNITASNSTASNVTSSNVVASDVNASCVAPSNVASSRVLVSDIDASHGEVQNICSKDGGSENPTFEDLESCLGLSAFEGVDKEAASCTGIKDAPVGALPADLHPTASQKSSSGPTRNRSRINGGQQQSNSVGRQASVGNFMEIYNYVHGLAGLCDWRVGPGLPGAYQYLDQFMQVTMLEHRRFLMHGVNRVRAGMRRSATMTGSGNEPDPASFIEEIDIADD